jgi:hypothetical protein
MRISAGYFTLRHRFAPSIARRRRGVFPVPAHCNRLQIFGALMPSFSKENLGGFVGIQGATGIQIEKAPFSKLLSADPAEKPRALPSWFGLAAKSRFYDSIIFGFSK